MDDYTLDELAEFSKTESKLLKELLSENNTSNQKQMPKKETLNFILNYSKALSVKKSESLKNIFTVLN